MFAGPNGSGKSTLKSYLPPELLGLYLNPDEVEKEIRERGFLDFSEFDVQATADEVRKFFAESIFLKEQGYAEVVATLSFVDGQLHFPNTAVDSYLTLVAVEFLRQKLLGQKSSFTFETVMSHAGKIDLLAQAQAAGYRTYLYFVATDDPAINISRVRNRVKLGGHDVPTDRIEKRYYRSLDLLMDAIRHTNRAYIFDNSGDSTDGKQTWIAEITESKKLELKTDKVPSWFKRAVLDKIKRRLKRS
jgi:predicted ABC-type ATPase